MSRIDIVNRVLSYRATAVGLRRMETNAARPNRASKHTPNTAGTIPPMVFKEIAKKFASKR